MCVLCHSNVTLSMSRLDNDKLKVQLVKKDEDLVNSKSTIERFTNAVSYFEDKLYVFDTVGSNETRTTVINYLSLI